MWGHIFSPTADEFGEILIKSMAITCAAVDMASVGHMSGAV